MTDEQRDAAAEKWLMDRHMAAFWYIGSASVAEWDEAYAAVDQASGEQTFVLDKTENPHPKMLEGAIQARRTARALGGDRALHYWTGYLTAMCDATGETPEALNAWIDRLSGDTSFDGTATRVELRRRK